MRYIKETELDFLTLIRPFNSNFLSSLYRFAIFKNWTRKVKTKRNIIVKETRQDISAFNYNTPWIWSENGMFQLSKFLVTSLVIFTLSYFFDQQRYRQLEEMLQETWILVLDLLPYDLGGKEKEIYRLSALSQGKWRLACLPHIMVSWESMDDADLMWNRKLKQYMNVRYYLAQH